jgi:MinD superfamily P-loop ATPase
MQGMIIGVTGGKGGTGKTVFAVNLALALVSLGKSVAYVDCDVDCPSSHLVAGYTPSKKKEVTSYLPDVNNEKCTKCGACARACQFNSILHIPGKNPLIDNSMCIGCRACELSCPEGAITGSSKVIGYTCHAEKFSIDFYSGSLLPSEILSEKIVESVKERAEKTPADITIIDTSAGAHCTVVRALEGCDSALAVTEPTAFGAHDYSVIAKVLENMKIPHQVILNRCDIASSDIDSSLRIPYDRKMLDCYVGKKPIFLEYPEHKISCSIADFAKRLIL